MAEFTIVLPEYVHRLVFSDIAELLEHGLRGLGHAVSVRGVPSDRTRNLILAPHLLRAAEQADKVRPGDIVYNFEPAESNLFEASLPLLTRSDVVAWDYSKQGAARLAELNVSARHVPLGYAPEMSRLERCKPEWDVLFYGSMCPRRADVLRKLRERGCAVKELFAFYGKERDYFISRSKCVLNLHYYTHAPTEDARLFYLLSNRIPVISEGPPDEPARKLGWALWCDYDKLVDEVCYFATLSGGVRERLGELGFLVFSGQQSEKSILWDALAAEGVK